ncbi:hypothetical protein FRZ06_01650 [Anoxybacterium hadale]|uniref:Uncharacterized protein n=1 Tax=Anoxybacterium hadale TaxID=3408580 RepID=A0ACD1A6W0_9FIRM|nr:hypothetical protein FRZ06_01650 [Clostridiales bacterium]
MKGKSLYIVSAIIIALPWIFLLEILPLPYHSIGTLTEIAIECAMFTSLLVVASLLRKDLKRQKQLKKSEQNEGISKPGGRGLRVIGRILFALTSLTIFLVGLVLLLIGISYSV